MKRPAATEALLQAALPALVVGVSAALVVGLLALVDSNHQEPLAVVIGHVAATAVWVTVASAIIIAMRRRRR